MPSNTNPHRSASSQPSPPGSPSVGNSHPPSPPMPTPINPPIRHPRHRANHHFSLPSRSGHLSFITGDRSMTTSSIGVLPISGKFRSHLHSIHMSSSVEPPPPHSHLPLPLSISFSPRPWDHVQTLPPRPIPRRSLSHPLKLCHNCDRHHCFGPLPPVGHAGSLPCRQVFPCHAGPCLGAVPCMLHLPPCWHPLHVHAGPFYDCAKHVLPVPTLESACFSK